MGIEANKYCSSARKVQQRISECESASTDDEADLAVPDGEAVSACAATTSEEEDRIEEPDHEIDDEASSSDEDEFMEADLIELEKTVIENIDKSLSDSLTEEQGSVYAVFMIIELSHGKAEAVNFIVILECVAQPYRGANLIVPGSERFASC
ncbi:unnamed protein product [Toxocara canis]|uniref:Uncharacterized protein n=1 Tax=Toxocara canis TaxID=6265 RepID=A0A183U780_TOXCA|nr:unnamed protein product [Toxocara canis]